MLDINDVKVEIVKGSVALDSVRKLLYQVYIKEMGWSLSEGNPSGLRIADSIDGKKMIVDDRDRQAIWFGLYYNEQIVGCARICERNTKGQFEVQAYNTGVDFSFLDKIPNLMEMTRGAIAPAFRGQHIGLLLQKAILDYLQINQLSVFGAPASERLVQIYQALEFPQIKGLYFKYEPRDPEAVPFFLALYEQDDIARMIKNIEAMLVHKTPLDYAMTQGTWDKALFKNNK